MNPDAATEVNRHCQTQEGKLRVTLRESEREEVSSPPLSGTPHPTPIPGKAYQGARNTVPRVPAADHKAVPEGGFGAERKSLYKWYFYKVPLTKREDIFW